jgi:predicted aspartyl protease
MLADGRVIEREIAIITMRLDGQIQPTVCVVGDDDTEPLLGAVTLEQFGRAADPLNRLLVPVPHLYLL